MPPGSVLKNTMPGIVRSQPSVGGSAGRRRVPGMVAEPKRTKRVGLEDVLDRARQAIHDFDLDTLLERLSKPELAFSTDSPAALEELALARQRQQMRERIGRGEPLTNRDLEIQRALGIRRSIVETTPLSEQKVGRSVLGALDSSIKSREIDAAKAALEQYGITDEGTIRTILGERARQEGDIRGYEWFGHGEDPVPAKDKETVELKQAQADTARELGLLPKPGTDPILNFLFPEVMAAVRGEGISAPWMAAELGLTLIPTPLKFGRGSLTALKAIPRSGVKRGVEAGITAGKASRPIVTTAKFSRDNIIAPFGAVALKTVGGVTAPAARSAFGRAVGRGMSATARGIAKTIPDDIGIQRPLPGTPEHARQGVVREAKDATMEKLHGMALYAKKRWLEPAASEAHEVGRILFSHRRSQIGLERALRQHAKLLSEEESRALLPLLSQRGVDDWRFVAENGIAQMGHEVDRLKAEIDRWEGLREAAIENGNDAARVNAEQTLVRRRNELYNAEVSIVANGHILGQLDEIEPWLAQGPINPHTGTPIVMLTDDAPKALHNAWSDVMDAPDVRESVLLQAHHDPDVLEQMMEGRLKRVQQTISGGVEFDRQQVTKARQRVRQAMKQRRDELEKEAAQARREAREDLVGTLRDAKRLENEALSPKHFPRTREVEVPPRPRTIEEAQAHVDALKSKYEAPARSAWERSPEYAGEAPIGMEAPPDVIPTRGAGKVRQAAAGLYEAEQKLEAAKQRLLAAKSENMRAVERERVAGWERKVKQRRGRLGEMTPTRASAKKEIEKLTSNGTIDPADLDPKSRFIVEQLEAGGQRHADNAAARAKAKRANVEQQIIVGRRQLLREIDDHLESAQGENRDLLLQWKSELEQIDDIEAGIEQIRVTREGKVSDLFPEENVAPREPSIEEQLGALGGTPTRKKRVRRTGVDARSAEALQAEKIRQRDNLMLRAQQIKNEAVRLEGEFKSRIAQLDQLELDLMEQIDNMAGQVFGGSDTDIAMGRFFPAVPGVPVDIVEGANQTFRVKQRSLTGRNVLLRPAEDESLKHHFTGKSILSGLFDANVPQVLADSLADAMSVSAQWKGVRWLYQHGKKAPGNRNADAWIAVTINPKGANSSRVRRVLEAKGKVEVNIFDDMTGNEVEEFMRETAFGAGGPRGSASETRVKVTLPGQKEPVELTFRELLERHHDLIAAGGIPELKDVRFVHKGTAARLFTPPGLNKVISAPHNKLSRGLISAATAIGDLQKAAILYFSPAYIGANFLGSVAMLMMKEGPFALKHLPKAALLHHQLPAWAAMQLAEETGQGFIMANLRAAGKLGRALQAPAKPIVQGFEIPTIMGKRIPGSGRVVPGFTSLADDIPRRIAWFHEAAKHGIKTRDDVVRLLGSSLDEDIALRAKISQAAKRSMVDFDDLTEFERTVLSKLIFIYPWLKGSTKWSIHFAMDNPYQAAAIGYIGNEIFQANQEALGDRRDFNDALVHAVKIDLPHFGEVVNFDLGEVEVPGLGKVPRAINVSQFLTFMQSVDLGRQLIGLVNRDTKFVNLMGPLYARLAEEAVGVEGFTGQELGGALGSSIAGDVFDFRGKRDIERALRSDQERAAKNAYSTRPTNQAQDIARIFTGTASPLGTGFGRESEILAQRRERMGEDYTEFEPAMVQEGILDYYENQGMPVEARDPLRQSITSYARNSEIRSEVMDAYQEEHGYRNRDSLSDREEILLEVEAWAKTAGELVSPDHEARVRQALDIMRTVPDEELDRLDAMRDDVREAVDQLFGWKTMRSIQRKYPGARDAAERVLRQKRQSGELTE